MIKAKVLTRRNLILWAGYLILALVLTWPTANQLTTHLPGDGGDDPAIAWNLWWVKYALLNEGQNPFHSDFIFYPIGINLAFYTLTTLNAITALPLTLNLGVVTASNLHMLFTFVVGAYGTFLLTRYVLTTILITDRRQLTATGNANGQWSTVNSLIWVSAAIAGGFYAFAGSKLFYVALGQFNIASNHWVPFAILYVLRTHRQPLRLKNALMAGLFLILQAWAEMTYASFLLVFIGLYWLFLILGFGYFGISTLLDMHFAQYKLWILDYKTTGRITALWPAIAIHLRAAVIMILTFTIGIIPILARMLPDMRVEGDFLVEGSGFADVFSADLLGFIIPTMHHPFLGDLITHTGIIDFQKGQHIYLGLALLGLMLVTLLTGYRYRSIRFWLIATVIFVLLSLGPIITINGQPTSISGPFTIFQYLPFFKGNRYPSRYSVMLILCLSVIAAFGLVQIGRWTGRLGTGPGKVKYYAPLMLIAALFVFEHLSLPLPQSDMHPPNAYQTIAADPNDFTVLDIPFAWRNGFRITGALTTQFMFGQFYQTTHQKRLLQGNTSRNPEFKFQYFTNAPVINSLLALETGKTLPPEQWQADKTIAADVLDFFNIKYIVVRSETSNPFGHYPQATSPYIEDVFPVELIHDDPDIKIYQVQNSNQESGLKSGFLINSGSSLAHLYFGEGWGMLSPGHPITAQREETRLLLPLTVSPQQITLRARLPEFAQTHTRSVHLELNGWQSDAQQITKAWQTFTFELPVEAIRPGLNGLHLHFDDVTSLPPLQPETPVLDVTVLSAGEEVGDFGHIFVNGHKVSPNQRGYNIALIQPGTLPQTANFDTHLDPAASTDLANFVNSAPAGTLIAIAAADEASAKLGKEAVLAMQTTGATDNLRGCFRCSHAIISQVDTNSERTLEALDPLRPVGVTTKLGLTEPNVAALVDWIQIEAIVP